MMTFALVAALASPALADLTPRQIYQKDGPAVVLLLCTGQDGVGELGSGSLIDDNGHILTNAHVVIKASTGEPYENLHAYFKPAKLTGDPKQDLINGKAARIIKSDRALDLALLELEDKPAGAAVMPIGDASAVQPGDPVVAIGHPEQGGLWTLTTGVVSTTLADLGGVKGKNVFQTDASINRGNSGGPLIDRQGNMIGVNTSMARKAADGLTITSVNFSLKSSVVKRWLGDSVALAAAAPAAVEAEPSPEPAAPVAHASPKAEAAAPRADDTVSTPELAIKAFGRNETRHTDASWDTPYPDPSFDDTVGRTGSPNASWHGAYHWDGSKLCLEVKGLTAPNAPSDVLSIGYTVTLKDRTFFNGAKTENIMVYKFAGNPRRSDIVKCVPTKGSEEAVAKSDEAPAPAPAPEETQAAPSKPQIVTPAKPYAISQLMQDMAEMEDLEKEMHEEVLKHKPQ